MAQQPRPCDVLVVGGGPAGATAALVLAREGARVTLLDKAQFPRPKPCGGLLTRKTLLLLQRLYGVCAGTGLHSGLIDHAASGYQVFLRERLFFQNHDGYPFHFVRREIFDEFLLRQATQAGVSVHQHTVVTSAAPERGQVLTSRGDLFQAPVIIGADGANSVLRRHCDIDRRAWKRNLAMAMEVAVPLRSLPDPPRQARVYAGFARGGYCWSFPNKDRALLGVCELARARISLKQRFKDFTKGLGLDNLAMPQPWAHPLPYGNFLKRPGKERVLLVGDAAGMVEPLFGEGIFYALRTGELAARAVLEHKENPLQAYCGALRRSIIPEFRWSMLLRNALFYCYRAHCLAPIKGLSYNGGRRILEIIHGERSFKLFGRRLQF